MNAKVVFALVLVAFLAGVAAVYVVISNQQGRGYQRMPHGPAGFQTQEQSQEGPAPSDLEGLGLPMGMGERQVNGDPFALSVTLSNETPQVGEEITVNTQVTSQTAPHARTKLIFYQNGEVVKELTGVIPPYQSETATFTWTSLKGEHTLKVVIASAVGIEFASWEKKLSI